MVEKTNRAFGELDYWTALLNVIFVSSNNVCVKKLVANPVRKHVL